MEEAQATGFSGLGGHDVQVDLKMPDFEEDITSKPKLRDLSNLTPSVQQSNNAGLCRRFKRMPLNP